MARPRLGMWQNGSRSLSSTTTRSSSKASAPYSSRANGRSTSSKSTSRRDRDDGSMSLCWTPTERSKASEIGCASLGRPGTGAIVVFSFSDQTQAVRRAMGAGAQGFISKAVPAQQIIDGVVAAARGERVVLTRRSQRAAIDEALRWPGREIGLTERESELLSLLSTGMTNRELGGHLYVSENTIKTQLRHLYAKLNVRNRAQAASFAGQGILGDHRSRSMLVE